MSEPTMSATEQRKSETERAALVLNRAAILQVVSDLRRYRKAAADLLAARYADGACDGYTVSVFADVVRGIEDPSDGDEDR